MIIPIIFLSVFQENWKFFAPAEESVTIINTRFEWLRRSFLWFNLIELITLKIISVWSYAENLLDDIYWNKIREIRKFLLLNVSLIIPKVSVITSITSLIRTDDYNYTNSWITCWSMSHDFVLLINGTEFDIIA